MKRSKKNIVNKITKNKFKILIPVLALVCIFSGILLTQKSFATADGTSGTCEWHIDANGKMTIQPAQGQSSCEIGEISYYDRQPWHTNSQDITSVEVEQGVIANANSSYLFQGLYNATSIDISNLDTNNVTEMTAMFYECSSLIQLDVTHLDTSNVIDMSYMFYECNSLTSLDVTHFDTSNVIGMTGMFQNCSSLTELNVTHFKTNKVTTFTDMFNGCSSLAELDVTHFDTSTIISEMNSVEGMFSGCKSLSTLDLSNFDMTNCPAPISFLDNVGSNLNEGSKIILNNTFDVTNMVSYDYDTDEEISAFPSEYYAKETNGTLSNKLYTISEMATVVQNSSTPTTWVPAYSVTYNGNGGNINGNNSLIKTYRIGTKINTNGVTPLKTNYDFIDWKDTQDGTGATLTINKNGESTNVYGSKYAAVGTNNNINLYAQYEEQEQAIDTTFNVNRKIDNAPKTVNNEFTYTITPDSNNPAIVEGIPSTFKIKFNNDASTNKTALKGIDINFNDAEYTKPGDYKFTIKETGSTDYVTYPLSTDEWEVHVSVRYKQSGGSPTSELITKSVVMKKKGESEKSEAIVFESETVLTSIKISEQVSGNMADTQEYFKLKVTIDGTTGDEYKITGLDSSVIYNNESVTNPTVFRVSNEPVYIYLKHGQEATIGLDNGKGEVKTGITYRVEEQDAGLYVTHINGSSTDSKDSGNLTTQNTGNNVSILNSYNEDVLTGVFLKIVPYLVIVGIAIIGIIYMVIRKSKKDIEE